LSSFKNVALAVGNKCLQVFLFPVRDMRPAKLLPVGQGRMEIKYFGCRLFIRPFPVKPLAGNFDAQISG